MFLCDFPKNISSRPLLRLIIFCIIVFLLCEFPSEGISQQIPVDVSEIDTTDKKDLIDVFKSTFHYTPEKIKKRGKKKVYFSLLPTSGSVPGGGKALITSTTAGFYLGSRKNTSLSNVNLVPYLNFKGRYSISLRDNIYTSRNKWNIQGETRFSYYPEYVYGGSFNNQQGQKLLIGYKYIRFYQTLLKRIKPYLMVGMGYNLDYHMDITVEEVGDTVQLSKFIGYEHGTGRNQNTVSSGITFNLLYDSRNNSLNPVPGAYFNFIYRVNPFFLGNFDDSWKSIYLDFRKYISLPGQRRHMVAVWTYLWSALNNDVPYLDLPANGYEPYQRSGRGIEQNRYRGKTLFYLEGEYRSDLRRDGLLGYVVFANTNLVTRPGNGKIAGPHPAIGTGLRIKFNKRSNTNIALDFATSIQYSTVTLNLGEVF
jgi:hypothetical protein